MPIAQQLQLRQNLVSTLACGATVAQAAAQTGVSERTVYRYLAKAEFRQQLEALQAETVQRSACRLTAAAPEALKVLIELQAPTMPPTVRRAAARHLCQLSQHHREAIRLEKRLQALENYEDPETTQPRRSNLRLFYTPGVSAKTTGNQPARQAAAKPVVRRKRGMHALLQALAQGASIAQAAIKAGVSERTVYRRLADATFRQQLQTLQAEMAQRAADLLLAGTMQATKTLIELLAPSTPASVRRAAACDVLELGMCFRQAVELENRIATLEARAGFSLAA